MCAVPPAQVVPTEYYSRFGGVTETHQYSVSEYLTPLPADGSHAPALDLLYELKRQALD